MCDGLRLDPKSNKVPSSVRIYTDWIPRESIRTPVDLEVVQINGTTINVEVFTKENEKVKPKRQEDDGI
jgi:hypothetical protein